MNIPDEVRLGVELLGLFGSAGIILMKLGSMGEKFNQQGIRLDKVDGRFDKMEKTVDKIEETLQVVAVQKDQIQSIREAEAQNARRTDETFTRVFTILDRLQARES